MKNKNLDKGIKEIQNIKMTSLEKSQILENVLSFSVTENQPIKSPYQGFSFSFLLKNTRLAYVVAVCLIFVLSSGGLVFASEASLPDSILYPIKVKIIEPIGGVLKFSAKEKAQYESKLSIKRISEAEALAQKNKLDDVNKKKLGDLLLNHMDALNKEIDKTDDNREANKIIDNFTKEMNVRAKILDNKKSEGRKVDGNKQNEISKEKSKDQEDKHKKIIKEIRSEDLEISNVVEMNTEVMKENQKKKELEVINKEIKKEEIHNDTIDTKVEKSINKSSDNSNNERKDKNDKHKENED